MRSLEWAALFALGAGALSAMGDEWGLDRVQVSGPVGARMDRYLQWAEQFGFGGAVLVARDGRIALHKAYGFAHRGRGVRNSVDTVFSFGSIAKQFTAAGILKLEQEGKLRTEDLISTYLSNVPEDKASITIHHLLTHSSGVIDSIPGSDFLEVSRDEAVERTFAEPLQFAPGSDFAYSNAGYSLAAAIIEVVSGLPYEEFMQQQIFKPAGMSATGFMGNDIWKPGQDAMIYRGLRERGSPSSLPGPFWVLLGNGGVVSTVGQMFLWDRALRGESVLGSDVRKKIFTPYLNDYGYGWDVVTTERGTTMHGHNGGSSLGLSAEFHRYIEEDGAFILASNGTIGTHLAIDYLTEPLDRLVFEDWAALPEVPVLTAPDLRRFRGVFRSKDGAEISFRREANVLIVYLYGQSALESAGVVGPDEEEAFDELNRRSKQILEGVFAGRLAPLRQAYGMDDEEGSRARAERWAQTIQSWPAARGDFQEVEILGTRQVRDYGVTAPVTWLRVRFVQGIRLCRFHWLNGRLDGLGGQAWPAPYYGPMRIMEDGKGLVFHFATAQRTKLAFSASRDGAIKSVRLLGDGGKATAFKRR